MNSPIYVPRNRTSFLLSTILPGSAIVGGPVYDPDHVVIYFEGNKHGASNLRRFVERCVSAEGRRSTTYPTTAIAQVPLADLIQVGEFNQAQARVFVSDEPALCAWLGLPTLPIAELVERNPLLVRSIEHLRALANNPEEPSECWLVLNHGMRSVKQCQWNEDRGMLWIHNEIDDTEEELTLEQVSSSLIGEAIRKHTFYYVMPDLDERVGY